MNEVPSKTKYVDWKTREDPERTAESMKSKKSTTTLRTWDGGAGNGAAVGWRSGATGDSSRKAREGDDEKRVHLGHRLNEWMGNYVHLQKKKEK